MRLSALLLYPFLRCGRSNQKSRQLLSKLMSSVLKRFKRLQKIDQANLPFFAGFTSFFPSCSVFFLCVKPAEVDSTCGAPVLAGIDSSRSIDAALLGLSKGERIRKIPTFDTLDTLSNDYPRQTDEGCFSQTFFVGSEGVSLRRGVEVSGAEN